MPNAMYPVRFHEDTIYYVEKDGDMYVPVRPIIENMGLDWNGQRVKLRDNSERWGVEIISTPSTGGNQDTICIPFRKLAGFLATINAGKVKPELRDKILRYQRECDDVLHEYWTTGKVEAKAHATPSLPEKLEAARIIFEMVNLEGNQLVLAVDKIYRREVGFSALEASNTQLVSPKQEITLTPTEIGEMLDPVLPPRVVNALLADAGYQKKVAKQWTPLPKAASLYVLLDTNKKHSSGTPVTQLKWYSGIVDVVRDLLGHQAE